ncbi:MAG: hypothetical protein U0800_04110 [Isosphaeraceae bacterium]
MNACDVITELPSADEAERAEPAEGRSRQGQGGGPKTSFGKAASSQNATTHSLTSTVVENLPTYFEADVTERIGAYAADYTPRTDSDWSLVRMAALAFVQHQEALNEQMYYLADRACRAQHCWKYQRIDEVARISNRLATRPSEKVAALMLSAAGASRLLEQWKMLGRALDNWGTWEEGHQRMAFDLLGMDEIERPLDIHGVANGSKEVRRALVDRHVEELQGLISGAFAEEDERLRDGALKGKGYLNEPGFRRLVSYERRALRMNQDCLAELERRKAEREAAEREEAATQAQAPRDTSITVAPDPKSPLENRPRALPGPIDSIPAAPTTARANAPDDRPSTQPDALDPREIARERARRRAEKKAGRRRNR